MTTTQHNIIELSHVKNMLAATECCIEAALRTYEFEILEQVVITAQFDQTAAVRKCGGPQAFAALVKEYVRRREAEEVELAKS